MRCKDDTKIFDLEHNLKLLPIDSPWRSPSAEMGPLRPPFCRPGKPGGGTQGLKGMPTALFAILSTVDWLAWPCDLAFTRGKCRQRSRAPAGGPQFKHTYLPLSLAESGHGASSTWHGRSLGVCTVAKAIVAAAGTLVCCMWGSEQARGKRLEGWSTDYS